jgi:DNA-binding NarL/FixJ family response regulator
VRKGDLPPMDTILIIDDHPGNLGVAVGHLEGYAFEVLTARDGETGVRRARGARPSLILLDVEMPGIDGYETCRRLKASEETRGIPVIFMTVRDSVGDKIRGFEVGAVDYVTKPFEAAELVARVRTHLELRALRLDLEDQVARRTAALERELTLREQVLREREALLELVRQQSDQLRELTRAWMEAQAERSEERTTAPRGGDAEGLRLAALLELSAREGEVLQLIVDGRSNKEIAGALDLARTSVSTYRMRLMKKLGVDDTAALVRRAVELGFQPR